VSRPAAPPRNARYLGHMRKDPRILSEMADEHGGPRHQGDTDGDDDRKELAIEAPAHTPGTGQMLARTDAFDVAGRNRQNCTASIVPVVAGCHPARASDNAMVLTRFQ
jgi:hypothetical protein